MISTPTWDVGHTIVKSKWVSGGAVHVPHGPARPGPAGHALSSRPGPARPVENRCGPARPAEIYSWPELGPARADGPARPGGFPEPFM